MTARTVVLAGVLDQILQDDRGVTLFALNVEPGRKIGFNLEIQLVRQRPQVIQRCLDQRGKINGDKFQLERALRREIAERAVRPLGVVFEAEVFNDDTGLGQGPELLAVEAFVAKAGVE